MSGFLQVEIDGMREELSVLEAAIGTFREYVEGAFREEAGYVEGMQSDFTPKLKEILENMKDERGESLLGKLDAYHQAATRIVDVLEKEMDQAMAQEMGGA